MAIRAVSLPTISALRRCHQSLGVADGCWKVSHRFCVLAPVGRPAGPVLREGRSVQVNAGFLGTVTLPSVQVTAGLFGTVTLRTARVVSVVWQIE